jgi:hypothetical protein
MSVPPSATEIDVERSRRPDTVAPVRGLGQELKVILDPHHRPRVTLEENDVEALKHRVDRGSRKAQIAQVRPRHQARALRE